MSIVIDVGLLLQILGVLIVLISQVWFVYKSRKEAGSLRKGFFEMVAVVRLRDRDRPHADMQGSEEYLKKVFPEWWALATYLSENIRDTAIGLGLTLFGLFFELINLTVTVC